MIQGRPKSLMGFSWTRGRQGGIGYPPLVIIYRNRWHRVEDSENHGGTNCRFCCGPCLRGRVEVWPYAESRVRTRFYKMPTMSWGQFSRLIHLRDSGVSSTTS